ncbi:MAG: response regulator transcription factor [Patescibacteria group bacterium]|nr:response regulator transcription factor [Patescibacteria group bacterium]
MRLLLVEDNQKLSSHLRERLNPNYIVDAVFNGDQAQDYFFQNDYQLIILDLGLPDINGLCLLNVFRKENFLKPILIISGFTSDQDVVQGLNQGADDYLTKPFSFIELEARITNLLRRKSVKLSKVIKIGQFTFDLINKQASYAQQPIFLRTKEKLILEALVVNAGRVLTKHILSSHAWDDPYMASNSLEVHISNLRQKIDKKFDIKLIKTVRGLGYTIAKNSPSIH